jgi:ADP-ribose pyrophosphatase YjhB (NUDIX family)
MDSGSFQNEHKLVVGKEYSFCPWCGTGLVEADIDGKIRKHCPKCDFINYRNPIPAAGAIIETDKGILLVKRKYPPYVGDWCFPAGFMEYGESPQVCCIRELKEETGLNITIHALFNIYAGKDDPRTRAVLILYLASADSVSPIPGDDADVCRYFSETEIPTNIAFASHRQAIGEFYEYKRLGKLPGQINE